MLSFGFHDQIDQVPIYSKPTSCKYQCIYLLFCYHCINVISLAQSQSNHIKRGPLYIKITGFINIIWLILSVSIHSKVITLSGFHCISKFHILAARTKLQNQTTSLSSSIFVRKRFRGANGHLGLHGRLG